MNGTMRFSGKALLMAGMILAALTGLILFAGCQKEPPAAQQPPQHSMQAPTPEHASTDQAQVKAVVAEQTTCPVMGGAINKKIFVEYKGKKVYFCCAGCPETFQANPEKYVAKLPQFQN
jgi:YHS domain-containing protein